MPDHIITIKSLLIKKKKEGNVGDFNQSTDCIPYILFETVKVLFKL